jgi:hypothetical protein
MNTYTIFQLVVFFELQERRDFETIKEILAIINSKEVKADKKRGLVLDKLRNAALLDIEFISAMPPQSRESIMAEYFRRAEKIKPKKPRNHGIEKG